MANFNTPYDDSFRTMLTDCKRLVIPLVNELFKANYSGNERVELFQNEVFITAGTDKKRVTDSNFSVNGEERHFNIECQSSPDGTMVLRMFEYASQHSIINGKMTDTGFRFIFPHSGVIQLRGSVPDKYNVIVDVPGGSVSYDMPVINIKDYTVDSIFEMKLWFLLPFMFFNYDLDKMNSDLSQVEGMKRSYEDLWDRLEQAVQNGELSDFEKCCIKAMCDKVAKALSNKHENVMKGVDEVMGGIVLDYEAKRIRNEAIEQGIEQGITKGLNFACLMISNGKSTVSETAASMGMTDDEFLATVKRHGLNIGE